MSPLTRVAAANPHAWFRQERSPAELVEVSPGNRMVSYPYTKNTMAIMDVDMAAAILVTSHAKADALGVPRDRRVYLRGWAYGKDPARVAERDEMWRSRAMEAASREALSRAGVAIHDIAHLDFYSCFASSLHFAKDALGIAEDDSRPLTVTGGLPYFGGAGNGYLSHSIGSMIEKLREEPEVFGMVSGVGMHMQNHVFGVYSATPGAVMPPDEGAVQRRIAEAPLREIRDAATGPATIAGYSVLHGRETFASAAVVCDLSDGRRCYARVEDPLLMADMEGHEWVGREVELVAGDKGVNLIRG
jgi:acetyl-CoA C-acetyltransferase